VADTDEWASLKGVGASIWLTGTKPPCTVHQSRPKGIAPSKLWQCVPQAERYCVRIGPDGRSLHVVDLQRGGGGRSIDAGTEIGAYEVAVAEGRLFSALCGPQPDWKTRRRCRLVDLEADRSTYDFETQNLRLVGASDEQGRPELRLALSFPHEHGLPKREDRRVALDGTMRLIDAKGRAQLDPPGGGLVLPIGETTSPLVDADGRERARLPFRPSAAEMAGPTGPASAASPPTAGAGSCRWRSRTRTGWRTGSSASASPVRNAASFQRAARLAVALRQQPRCCSASVSTADSAPLQSHNRAVDSKGGNDDGGPDTLSFDLRGGRVHLRHAARCGARLSGQAISASASHIVISAPGA
jgi:hypothetical protein